MKNLRHGISLALVLVLLTQMLSLPALAVSRTGAGAYENFVILGDSLCLGFSSDVSSMMATDTFDILSNVYRAANGHNSKGEVSLDYTHSYPTVFAKKIGIDTFRNNEETYIFTEGDDYDDVYNFGVCAAWAGDMLEMISDPYYVYPYFYQNYDSETTFALPKAYKITRDKVINYPNNPYGVDSTGYKIEDPTTWQYAQVTNLGEEGFNAYNKNTWIVEPNSAKNTIKKITYGTDWMTGAEGWTVSYNTENITVPKETEIKVAEPYLSKIIIPNYFFVGEDCLDENGEIDEEKECHYYPANNWDGYSIPTPKTKKISKNDIALYGEPVLNPQFTRYYYPYVVDKIKNGDLIALACGGNDVYHSFQDQYMAAGMTNADGSTNILGALLYLLNYAFQTSMTVGDIAAMLGDPEMLEMMGWMMGVDLSDLIELLDFEAVAEDMAVAEEMAEDMAVAEEMAEDMAVAEEEAVHKDMGPNLDGAGTDTGEVGLLGSVKESLSWLFDYYSSEKVTAFMNEKAIPEYKENYEKCIQRCLELKDDDAELVLVGHYNPFGIRNYIQMMNLAMRNGELGKHLWSGSSALFSLLTAIIGSPETYSEMAELSDAQLEAAMAAESAKLQQILDAINDNNQDLTQAVFDTSIPLVVLLMNDALSETYEQFNGFVEDMAEEYGLAYVDVSDAPCAGRFDPHPTKFGHAWIADRLYETVLPTIKASVTPERGATLLERVFGMATHGRIVPEGVFGAFGQASTLRFRLRDSQTYSITADEGYCIQAIFVDGEKIDLVESPNLSRIRASEDGSALYKAKYTFNDILASHKIEVQVGVYGETDTYTVSVLGSEAESSGVGEYEAGEIVTLDAGEKAGYTFNGWTAEYGAVKFDDASKAQTTFVMPAKDVKVRANWKVSETETDNDDDDVIYVDRGYTNPSKTVVTFNTNGGSEIPSATVKYGETIDLTEYVTRREGYTFGGWFTDSALTRPVTALKGNTDRAAVFAKWVPNGVDGCLKESDCPIDQFTDTKNSAWWHDGIHYCVETGLMNGVEPTTFAPNSPLTRGMIATILWRMESSPVVNYAMSFKDVPTDWWYAEAIRWAQSTGVVQGYSAEQFGPEDNVTREQLAAILYRYAQLKGKGFGGDWYFLLDFVDRGMISTWADEAVHWCSMQKIVNGKEGKVFDPLGNATRAEAATMLQRFCAEFAE